MKVLVDGDACPVKDIIIKHCKEREIELIIFIDTSHVLNPVYGQVITIEKGPDAVDIALMNKCSLGDIVITQDYGVAAMALGKRAYVLNEKGMEYTNDNIDMLLFQRHVGQKARRAGKRPSVIKKRTSEDDKSFERSFLNLLDKVNSF